MNVKYETSAGGIVYKKEGNRTLWLITQHSYHKGWVFPKGLIGDHDEEEKKEKAALREVKEEGGVVAKIVHPEPIVAKYNYRFKEYFVKKTVYYFLMEYVSGNPENHDWEMMDARFAPVEEVKKTLTYKSDKEAFEKILEIFKKISS